MKKSFLVGILLLVSSLTLAFFIFFPIVKEVFKYFYSNVIQTRQLPNKEISTKLHSVVVSTTEEKPKPTNGILDQAKHDTPTKIIAVDKNFSIVIPKIGANTKVIKNVDPYNSNVYQQALSKGVAHAKGSALPNADGNTFLFAHSSDNFINANRYNSVFYLLYKLKVDDSIYLAYKGKVLEYSVLSMQYVNPENIEYLSPTYGSNTLTLMTCWPPGTTLKRLVVIAKLVEQQ
jgi:sortase A